MLIEIKHLDAPELEPYCRLTDVKLRRELEPERGIYLAESFNVIERALRAGHRALSILTCPKWLPKLAPILRLYCQIGKESGRATSSDHLDDRAFLASVPLPIYVAETETLEQITGFHLHRGAISAMQRPVLPTAAELLTRSSRVAVLEDLVDHKNVGAAIRSVAAMNFDAVLVTPRCADPLYRRSVRVSMGTVFQLPWARLPEWPNLDLFHDHGYLTVALALSKDAVSLADFCRWLGSEAPSDQKVALLFGSEGPGLTKPTLRQADQVVQIPMGHGVDSLNVAAASAVATYAIANA